MSSGWMSEKMLSLPIASGAYPRTNAQNGGTAKDYLTLPVSYSNQVRCIVDQSADRKCAALVLTSSYRFAQLR